MASMSIHSINEDDTSLAQSLYGHFVDLEVEEMVVTIQDSRALRKKDKAFSNTFRKSRVEFGTELSNFAAHQQSSFDCNADQNTGDELIFPLDDLDFLR
mmetsp:Transcript_3583/g.5744  ORF Transcript_3583/g.5744 Transcript_3583/m.5744 type:complete len:99 (+) Transcript_3583:176-472(+)